MYHISIILHKIEFPGRKHNACTLNIIIAMQVLYFYLSIITGLFDLLGGPEILLPEIIILLHAMYKYLGSVFNFDVTFTPPHFLQ